MKQSDNIKIDEKHNCYIKETMNNDDMNNDLRMIDRWNKYVYSTSTLFQLYTHFLGFHVWSILLLLNRLFMYFID